MRHTAGEVLSRVRDDVNETLSFMEGWGDALGQAVFTVIALTILWHVDRNATLAVIPPMLLVVVITQRITAGIHRYSRVAREAEARVTSFVGEMFTAVQAIRVAGAEPRILARLGELNEERRRTAVRYRGSTSPSWIRSGPARPAWRSAWCLLIAARCTFAMAGSARATSPSSPPMW